MEQKLIQVSIQFNGAYFTYQLDVPRGIKGKTKAKVKEVLIHGVPTKRVQQYCLDNKLVITDRAVYENNDMDCPILFRQGDTLTYVEKEKLNAQE